MTGNSSRRQGRVSRIPAAAPVTDLVFFREDRNRIAGLEFSAVAPRPPARQAGHLARQAQSIFFSAPDYSKVTSPVPEKLRQAPSAPIPVACAHFSPARWPARSV